MQPELLERSARLQFAAALQPDSFMMNPNAPRVLNLLFLPLNPTTPPTSNPAICRWGDEKPKRGPVARLAMLLAPLYGAIYDAQMSVRGVRLVRHRIQLSNYPHNAPPLKIGFLSDLHYGPVSGRGRYPSGVDAVA
jgi:hypothetical protein